MAFAVGQRWISNTETELGLGIVIALSARQVTFLFPASDENRIYSSTEPPVIRVIFNPGDVITSHEGWRLKVTEVREENQLMVYSGNRLDTGQPASLWENVLDSKQVFSRPQDRLFAGFTEPMQHFMLRYYARQYYSEQYCLPWSGLRGTRTSLIAHQLHIANEVAGRQAPRVLLADEVGLGKTIEAGMIIHQQLLAGSAERVLIVVPQSLQHQWLVEMLRRFNLHFSLFDDSRYNAELSEADNPFDSEQLVICSLDFLCASQQRLDLLALANWDMLVVDEAHHLVWDETWPGDAYRCIEQLAQQIPAVLLLTATPEQPGITSHFARLRLLDCHRFHDLNTFLAEQQQYRPVADAVALLLEGNRLNDKQTAVLKALVSEQDITPLLQQANSNTAHGDNARQALINMLLDRHGTSRLLFRNTRQGVTGFPRRVLHPVMLPLVPQYEAALAAYLPEQGINAVLYPELLYQSQQYDDNWYNIDPRVAWLADFLKQQRQHKVLVICANAGTAVHLEQALREGQGIRASVFHEGMTIIERDRAAAWFADQETGAQVLICSEIGSEGRNFQFASRLIMFDLPANPDLLEQRIGRLDRIGQCQDVQLYVPYMENTAQALLLRWYHEGLNAFEQTCSTARPVFTMYYQQLVQFLVNPRRDNAEFTGFIQQCRAQHERLKQQLEQGRDRLLEVHSGGGEAAQRLASAIAEQDNDGTLMDFCNILFDIIGVHYDALDEQLFTLMPHSAMLIPDFPGLAREGCSVTFNRQLALAREDVQFLTWEHPIIRHGLDLILSGDTGICSLALLKFPELPAGTLLLELLYVVETTASRKLRLQRFLPPVPLRLLLDKNGNNMADSISFQRLQNRLEPVNRHTASKLGRIVKDSVNPMLTLAEPLAEQAAGVIIAAAQAKAQQLLNSEIDRLQALKKVNPAIRDDELQALMHNRDLVLSSLNQAHWRLDALRLIVVAE